MHNLIIVEVAKSQHDLRCNKFDLLLVESLHLVKVIINISSVNILKEKVNSQFVLKHILHMVAEGVVSLKQDFLFNFDIFNLILLQNHILI